MSGGAIPYHLRSHKYVDRRLFVDLLSRFERWRSLDQYVYVSMGAYPLEDHKLVHRIVGMTRLIAFDMDEDVVSRQEFNRPVESCVCLHKKSGEIVSEFQAILTDCGFGDAEGAVIWLDYTDPKKIGSQIREFQSLLDKLRSGDVVRITVCAHPNEFMEPRQGDVPLQKTEKMEKQFANLKKWIGDYLPSWASADHMTIDGLPLVLSHSFSSAALRSFPANGALTFSPLSVIRYADTTQMLSFTGAIVEKKDEPGMRESIGLERWPFSSPDWGRIHRLLVPVLTVRERLFLERGILAKEGDELISGLGFGKASNVDMKDFISSYKSYYRFYPTLLPSEV